MWTRGGVWDDRGKAGEGWRMDRLLVPPASGVAVFKGQLQAC